MVTYSDLTRFCILIVALVSLCYKIFEDKKEIAATTANSGGIWHFTILNAMFLLKHLVEFAKNSHSVPMRRHLTMRAM